MLKFHGSLIAAVVHATRFSIRPLVAHTCVVGMGLALLLSVVANAADVIWDGSSSATWSDTANWNTNALPGSGDVVRFDQLSLANLNINNDAAGVSIAGFANTSLAANNGPAGPMTITGNAITLGSMGIDNGSGNPLDPNYPGPAQANITLDVDLTLSADQRWKIGGPGTGTTAQPSGNQAIIIGATPNTHTVTLNGFKPILSVISNPSDMIIVNSKLVDGSAASIVRLSKITGSATTYIPDTGNINNNPRVRIAGDSTYSGGTEIIAGRQLIQLATSTAKNLSGNIISGPLGTGTITVTDSAGNDQGAHLVAWGANRTLDNPIAFTTTGNTFNFASTVDDTGHYSLTLGGNITAAANATLTMGNTNGASPNQRFGSGDVIINGNIVMTGNTGTLQLGQGGATPTAGVVVGKMVINGNIQETGTGNVVTIVNGTATVPTVVQLSGQSTYAGGTTLVTANGSSPTADANLGIGSSSVVVTGNIVSGPLGTGTLNIGNQTTGTTSSVEALGGARTVDNPINLTLLQSNLVVRGSNDLTLNGAILGFGGVTKSGTGKLILGGTSTYIGATAVNSGTLLVNGSLTGTSGVAVASGATLGGGTTATPGVITGPVTSTGTISPGSSIGTLTLNNALTLNDTSSLLFELGSAGSHDLINVGTDVTIPTTGAGTVTVNLANAGGMGAGTFTLIDYAGALNGDFATLMLGTQPAGFTYSLINNTANTSIDLQLTAATLSGDYNNDGKVNAADYVIWRKNPTVVGGGNPAGYNLWRANFGNPPGSGSSLGTSDAVPEPASLLLLLAGGSALIATNLIGGRRKRRIG